MTMNSIIFYVFFIIVLLPYYTILRGKARWQNLWLLVTSLFFYAWAEVKMLLLLIASVSIFFFLGRAIEQSREQHKSRARLLMGAGVVLGILALFFFKYLGFFVNEITSLVQALGMQPNVPTLNVLVPLGISYFTFKLMSYVVDVYQGKMASCSDGIAFAAYVSFFPTIMSGPIDRARDFLPQLQKGRFFDVHNVSQGVIGIVWGLFLKMCIADRINPYTDAVFNNLAMHNGPTVAVASVLFLIQMYADFCGYSCMAIAAGRLLGLRVAENFMRPFFAVNGADFWRRWHISLSSWLRDYVYIPLGGNRCSRWRSYYNVMVTFVLCGLWHGANWTYVVFGVHHGVLVVLSRVFKAPREKLESRCGWLKDSVIYRTCRQLVTFAACAVGAMFFRANSFSDICLGLSKLFGEIGPVYSEGTLPIFTFGLLSVAMMFFSEYQQEYNGGWRPLSSSSLVVRSLALSGLIVWIVMTGELESVSFIYFQF